jgi:hypothetical protein
MLKIAFVATLWFAVTGHSVRADLINFEEGANLGGQSIATHYSGLTFSNAVWITPAFTGFSNNEFWDGNAGLGAQTGVQNDYPWAYTGITNPIVITFSTPQSSVSIGAFDVGTNGAGIQAFDALGNLIASDNVQGTDAGFFNNLTLSVTARGIRSIHLDQPFYSGFPDGIGFDNLQFTPSSVPEPGSITLLSLSLAGVLGVARRKWSIAQTLAAIDNAR